MRRFLAVLLLATSSFALAATPTPNTIPAGSHIFLEDMNGFEADFTAALQKKHVPLIVTDNKEKADYFVSAKSTIQNAGWAKTIFVSPLPAAHASITIKSKSGDTVFAYAVDKMSARKGTQSTAEACAKHLKDVVK